MRVAPNVELAPLQLIDHWIDYFLIESVGDGSEDFELPDVEIYPQVMARTSEEEGARTSEEEEYTDPIQWVCSLGIEINSEKEPSFPFCCEIEICGSFYVAEGLEKDDEIKLVTTFGVEILYNAASQIIHGIASQSRCAPQMIPMIPMIDVRFLTPEDCGLDLDLTEKAWALREKKKKKFQSEDT